VSDRPLILLRRVEVEGAIVDVRVEDGVIAAVGADLPAVAGADEIDGAGGTLLPGLHDHHVHLFAMAAAARSIQASGDVLATLRAADRELAPGAWIRAVGWHEHGGVDLDRDTLDAAVPGRPVRVQHATGALWVLNSRALDAVGLAGHPTGRLFGADDLLRQRLGADAPDLTDVGAALCAVGVTAVTDATPYASRRDLETLAAAVADAGLAQRVVVTAAPDVDVLAVQRLDGGPAKVIVADHDLPSVDALADQVAAARHHGRTVAFHCASRVALVLALAALDVVGARRGDRIEHGAVIPDDAIDALCRRRLTVVTQPALVAERGDRFLDEVEPGDRPHLWRCASLLAAGVPVAGSTDAPLGPADPWRAIAAATSRRTAGGAVLGPGERVDGRTALGLFLGPLERPGGPPRRVTRGAPADLCLLHVPLAEALAAPDASVVRATLPAHSFL